VEDVEDVGEQRGVRGLVPGQRPPAALPSWSSRTQHHPVRLRQGQRVLGRLVRRALVTVFTIGQHRPAGAPHDRGVTRTGAVPSNREHGDQRAANEAAEHALALAESDRVVLPFAMTSSAELLEALPRHQTAHAALLADISTSSTAHP